MGFIHGANRHEEILFPERLDDSIAEENPVRFLDAFVDHLNLTTLGFQRAKPAATGRPAPHPAGLLKLYIYGYLYRLRSSRHLEQETHRNVDEHLLEEMEQRVRSRPEVMRQRKQQVEHPFGTMKRWWDAGYFFMRGLEKVRTERSFAVLAYNLRRLANLVGIPRLIAALGSVRVRE